MGREAKARQERREQRAAVLEKHMDLERLAHRLDMAHEARDRLARMRSKGIAWTAPEKPLAPVADPPRVEDGWVFADGQ